MKSLFTSWSANHFVISGDAAQITDHRPRTSCWIGVPMARPIDFRRLSDGSVFPASMRSTALALFPIRSANMAAEISRARQMLCRLRPNTCAGSAARFILA